MVITGLTRNQFAGNGTRVRIPPSPPSKGYKKDIATEKTLILSEFFLFLWVKFYFSVCTYKKDIFLNTDSNSHKVATFKEHRINYAPFCFCRSTYDFFETIPNKPLLNLEKFRELCYTYIMYNCIFVETEDCSMDNNIERWYSMKEIMEYLGVSRDTVLDWIERRNMPAAKIGRLWKFKVSEVDAWMKSGVAADK